MDQSKENTLAIAAQPLENTQKPPYEYFHKPSSVVSEQYNITRYFNENFKELSNHVQELLPLEPEEKNKEIDRRVKEFIGDDISEDQFLQLKIYCCPDQLRTTYEIPFKTTVDYSSPFKVVSREDGIRLRQMPQLLRKASLNTNKRLKTRLQNDPQNLYQRSVRNHSGINNSISKIIPEVKQGEIPEGYKVPGKDDLIYHFRVYRPLQYNANSKKTYTHYTYYCVQDLVMLGDATLSQLKDQINCLNMNQIGVDMSENIDMTIPSLKIAFPSGFLYINGVFYEDRSIGALDYTSEIVNWAKSIGKNIGPVRDIAGIKLKDIEMRLGYYELLVHMGKCEHMFTLSEVRRANSLDVAPLPSTALISTRTPNCITCVHFTSEWIVMDTVRSIFQPAYYCNECFKSYNYVDGKKVENFKAYKISGVYP